MEFWENIWVLLWFTFWFCLIVSFVAVLFWVVGDLFRDRTLNGWLKALWVVGFIFLPFLGLLIYLIARGSGMAERNERYVNISQDAQASHIRSITGVSVSDEITQARALFDAGSITAEEYARIKEQALTA